MEYFSQLDARDRSTLENYSLRLNQNSSREAFTPMTSSRTNLSQRLPTVNSFSTVLSKPTNEELIPKPEVSSISNPKQRKTPKRKNSRNKLKMNGKFYNENGLNTNHPELIFQIQKIFNLIDTHKHKFHQDLETTNFSALKKHFFS